MTRIPPISSSRYRFFPPKGCVADRKHIPWTKKLPQYMKTDPWGCVVNGKHYLCLLFSTRHKVFQQKECIADKMTRIPRISSSRYRFFPPKECVADRKHIPWTQMPPRNMKTDIKGVSRRENITSAPFSARDTRYFSKKGVSRIGTVPWLQKDWQSRNTLNPYIIES